MSTMRDIKSKLTRKALDALCTKYHIPACVYLTLPGPDENILQSPDGQIEMDLYAFVCHSDPTKVRIRERDLAEREVELLKMTEGRTVSLDPLATTASRGSGDSIDKLFDEEDDAGQEHSVKKDDDVLDETIARDVSDVAIEKAKKKQKRKVTGDASGSTHPPKKLSDDYQFALPNTSGKSLATLCGLVPDSSGIPSGVTEPLIAAFVAPMPNVGPTDSVSGLSLRTCPPNMRYIVSSDDSHHSGSYSEATSFVRYLVADASIMTVIVTTTVVTDVFAILGSKARVESKNLENIGDSASAGGANADAASISKLNKPSPSSDSFYTSQSLDTETMHRVYVPRWKVTNDSVLEDAYVYRDLTDRLASPALFAQLQVRMRAEHTLEKNGELEDKCAKQAALLSERDTEIVHPKSILSLKEVEAAEAIRLYGQLTTMKDVDAAKDNELKDLKEKNFTLEGERCYLSRDELNSQAASLESKRDGLINQMSLLEYAFKLFSARIEATRDEQENVLRNRVAELDAQLLEMAAHLDKEFYPRFLTAISEWRWILTHGLKLVILKCLQSPEYCHALGTAIGCTVNKGIQDGPRARVDHGKAERDLSVIEAYDPFAKAKYVEAVNALGVVDFSLLSELKYKKDASIVDLMDSLRLDGPLAEIPIAEDLQPSPEQIRLLVDRPKDNVVLGETSLSFSLQVVHSQVQRVKGEIIEKRLSLTDVMAPLADPLSS
uniref:Transposase (Putative), gypsy type n=1 Tax=Tanacetum cinerariifolium TaxID=118510 RepID=A0A6L2KWC5_TANCI|nr:hypothetical protein [Tanacetum cinerariifolium]